MGLNNDNPRERVDNSANPAGGTPAARDNSAEDKDLKAEGGFSQEERQTADSPEGEVSPSAESIADPPKGEVSPSAESIADPPKGEVSPSRRAGTADKAELTLLEQLMPLARQLNCLDIDRIATVCVGKIPRFLNARLASLYLIDETKNMLHLQKCNHPYLINKIVSLNQNPPTAMVVAAKSGKIIHINDIDSYAEPVIKKSQRPYTDNYGTKNCIIVPLLCQDKVVGVLNIADKPDKDGFSNEDITLVELLSQLIGASIGNIALFERTQHQARTDGLTGLVNHKTFYEMLERELWRSRRFAERISLIMVDVDNLKPINDQYGHRAGDKVIKEIGQRIKETIRQIDIAARYGGDEFAIILPNTSLTDATVVAERLVGIVAQTPVVWRKDEIAISISVGIGQLDENDTPDDIASRSDKALYSAKKAGKNTFKIYQPNKK